jgi:hypothetical protein
MHILIGLGLAVVLLWGWLIGQRDVVENVTTTEIRVCGRVWDRR